MKKKIVGIIVCTLLIATIALPVAMSMNDNNKKVVNNYISLN